MWPVLHLSEWFRVACMEPFDGFYFLGGHRLHEDLDSIKHMLRDFWGKHKYHDNFGPPPNPELTIPFYIHGDEGRGQVKRPIKVVSFQPCISWMGGEYHNMKKPLMSPHMLVCWNLPLHAEAYVHNQVALHSYSIRVLRCQGGHTSVFDAKFG